MSSVVLESIRRDHGKMVLGLSGVDILDQSPVLDIKPYLPYSDIIPEAVGGFATDPPGASLSIDFTAQARQACAMLEKTYPGFTELVVQVLRADPRPAYMESRSEKTEFGLRLYDRNIRWVLRSGTIVIDSIEKIAPGSDTNR
jgi:hypothetical protein